jgi:DNA polymerase III subunit gamma/tau
MLRLLADHETGIRRSVSPRLVVETMLLRWAMMDRTVDLEEVIKAGQRGSGAGTSAPTRSVPVPKVDPAQTEPPGRGPSTQGIPAPQTAPPPTHPQAGTRPAAPPDSVSLDAISAAWPAMVMAVRAQSRFLGEAFAATEPAGLELPWLTVMMREPNPLFAERLLQEAGKVEEVLSRSLGQPVRLRVTGAEAPQGAGPGKPKRMSEASLKAERLREFRSKDPALDTAADALDLEIVD